jgi:flavin reductase (DIM6/NTAB) family NADH-FMN oxidoreductase RutF
MGAFPTGVTVVTSMTAGGQPRGMTCSAVSSVTLSPPTILVCLRRGTRTTEAVRNRAAFGINMLHSRGRATAEVFAAPFKDRFEVTDWRPSRLGLPRLLRDAFAFAECEVVNAVESGDHTVYFGHVHHVDQVDDVPLVYGLREFGAWRSGADVPA